MKAPIIVDPKIGGIHGNGLHARPYVAVQVDNHHGCGCRLSSFCSKLPKEFRRHFVHFELCDGFSIDHPLRWATNENKHISAQHS